MLEKDISKYTKEALDVNLSQSCFQEKLLDIKNKTLISETRSIDLKLTSEEGADTYAELSFIT